MRKHNSFWMLFEADQQVFVAVQICDREVILRSI
jgi:hypothetical protein